MFFKEYYYEHFTIRALHLWEAAQIHVSIHDHDDLNLHLRCRGRSLISNFIGAEPFAAINIVMPFLMIFGSVGFMLGTGGSALVAYTLGTGNHKKANEIFSLLVYVLIVVGLLFTVLGELFLAPISGLLGADASMLPYCIQYGRIILVALVPFMLQNVFQSLLVTAERPQLGLYITIIAGVTNVILDALLSQSLSSEYQVLPLQPPSASPSVVLFRLFISCSRTRAGCASGKHIWIRAPSSKPAQTVLPSS